MINRLKQLIRHSAVYSINSIAEKAVGLIVLPLLTAKLAPGQFGDYDLLEITINILGDVLLFGLGTVIILFSNPKEYQFEQKSAFFTLSLFILFISLFFTAAVEIFFSFGIPPSQLSPQIISIIKICSYIISFRLLNNFILGKLRADERPVYYTVGNSVKLFLRTGMIVYCLTSTANKLEGVFYSFLISEIIMFFIFLPVVLKSIAFKLNYPALTASLKIGLPLVFGSIGFSLLNLSDRYIIKLLMGEHWVGLYGLGYRAAGILNMFLILPFTLTLLPVTYKVYKQKNDKRFLSKLMTYSTFFFVWGFVAISLFSVEIIKIMGQQESFHSAYAIVPIILLGYVFSGMRMNASLGMMLTKNTKHVGTTTIISAILNIALNFIFIPYFGIVAAAINTLVAYIIFYLLTLKKSDSYYKIPFETGKLITLIITGSLLSSVIYLLPAISLLYAILIKGLIIVSFPFIIYVFKFYEKEELDILLNKEKLFDFVKGIFKRNTNIEIKDDIEIK